MKLGEILLRKGEITQEQLDGALETQVVYGGRIGTNLVELGHVRLDAISAALVEQLGVPQVDPADLDDIPAEVLETISKEACGNLGCIPVRQEDEGVLRVAVLDPSPAKVVELCRFFGCGVKPLVVPELRFHYLLERFYGVPRRKRFMRAPDGGEQAPRQRRRYMSANVRPATGAIATVRTQPGLALDARSTEIIAVPVDEEDDDIATTGEIVLPEQLAVPARSGVAPTLTGPQTVYVKQLLDRCDDLLEHTEPDLQPWESSSVDDIVQQLNNAQSGAEIAQLLVEPLFNDSALTVLFWVRGTHAVGCCAAGAHPSQVQQLAVGLDKPSVLQWALNLRSVVRANGSDDISQLQIASFLKTPEPSQVCVAPVKLRAKVVNLICVHSVPGAEIPDETVAALRSLANAATRAYRRLQSRVRRDPNKKPR